MTAHQHTPPIDCALGVAPPTSIFDAEGRDWTWAFVIYRPLEGYPGYCIGSDGTVWSRRPINGIGSFKTTWRRMGGFAHIHGHKVVSLMRGDSQVIRYIHRLVLQTFIGPCPDGMLACHWDDRPENNNLRNLRWDTQKGNRADCIRNGTCARGEKIGQAKLTESDILTIRELAADGWEQKVLARRFGVSGTNVGDILSGKTWKHVGGPTRPPRKRTRRVA